MESSIRFLAYWLTLTLLPLATAQSTNNVATTVSGLNAIPIATDDAPQLTPVPPNTQTATFTPTPSPTPSSAASFDSSGLVNYYFVFLALIICIAGLGVFLLWRRKRRSALVAARTGRTSALHSHLYPHRTRAWGATGWEERRRQWLGRDAGREEGLDERGEAPPPYVPKRDEEGGGPAVPMQALRRDDVGMKPPDYEAEARDVGDRSSGEGSSTRPQN